jgi:hypothetical protein
MEVFVVKGEADVMGAGPVLEKQGPEAQAGGAACCVPKSATAARRARGHGASVVNEVAEKKARGLKKTEAPSN